MIRYLLPLALFIGLVVIFIYGLQHDPRLVPSPLIDKPAPTFNLPTLHTPETTINIETLKGKVSLINVWASWCAACRTEHPVLIEARTNNSELNLYGLNYKDKRPDALQWLQQLGNPYIESAFDEEGSVGIDYGVYGVPETFVLDKKGIIRYKHIGPVDKQQFETIILPLVKKLELEKL
jgi:cytochrome c biogenesis protein CcmG, thiol:disulfide interchange protein DsbE